MRKNTVASKQKNRSRQKNTKRIEKRDMLYLIDIEKNIFIVNIFPLLPISNLISLSLVNRQMKQIFYEYYDEIYPELKKKMSYRSTGSKNQIIHSRFDNNIIIKFKL